MTTICESLAIDPAARIRCSSSERFIDAPTLLIGQNACKGRGLSHARAVFTGLRDESCNLLPGLLQHPLPFFEPRWTRVFPPCIPPLEVSMGNREQCRVALDFPGDDRMHRQAPCFD